MPGRKKGEATQAVRMFRMLELIRSKRYGARYKELADAFGVDVRTVTRDLDALQSAGLPVVKDRDEENHVVVKLDEPGPASLQLTVSECYALLATRRLFDVFEGTPIREDVHGIFNKVVAALPRSQKSDVEDVQERIAFVPDDGHKNYEGKTDLIITLMDCALKNRELAFRYRPLRNKGRDKSGVLRPYALVLYRYGLYAVGARTYAGDWSDAAERVYALERFLEIEPGSAHFERPESFSVERFFRGAFGLHTGAEERRVRLLFSREAAPYVMARIYQPDQHVEFQDGGRVQLSFSVTDLTEVVPFVLRWGRQCEVLEPPALAQEVARARGDEVRQPTPGIAQTPNRRG
jgi:predicted DNA-binding transcriptional regulator YafY